MKTLIFSHVSDIDGMGGVVLAKLAFSDVDYVLCETFNLCDKIKEKVDDGSIYNYDQIFITDMWVENPDIILNNDFLKNRVLVFDHHESALDVKNLKDLDFVNIKIFDDVGRCSGTSLFYSYLKKNRLLADSLACQEFVELTRLYDTWEWITVKNEPMARDLTTLFNAVGPDAYIKLMVDKLSSNSKNFSFNELENSLIKAKNEQILKKMQEYSRRIHFREVLGLKGEIIFVSYEYRNDLAQYLRDIKVDLDFVMMVSIDNGTISYRNITPGVNVRVIAEYFGGKGHDYAASSPIEKDKLDVIVDILIRKL